MRLTARQHIGLPAVLLVLVAGSATPAFAQNNDKPATRLPDKGPRADQEHAAQNNIDFRAIAWLKGRDVVNDSGEKIAEISEFLIDRGTGQIEYAFIESGGRELAVPYASLRWNTGNDMFVTELSSEQFKQHPAFSIAEWRKLAEPVDTTKRSPRANPPFRPDRRADLYAGRYETGRATLFEGDVKNVERLNSGENDEQVIITLTTDDGKNRRVALGPSWFVAAAGGLPGRGDRVVVDTYAIAGESGLCTARRITIDGRTSMLRRDDGRARWSVPMFESDGKFYNSETWRYVIAGELKGMKVDCRGDRCGELQDAIVDRTSGRVILLSIDPDENVLGVGDTRRLVPWSIASAGADAVIRLDASKEMIIASPETPSDLTVLNTNPVARMVYNAYQVEPPKLEPVKFRPLATPNQRADTCWCTDGPIAAAISKGPLATWTGTVLRVDEVRLTDAPQPARAIRIRTDAGKEETVVIGPAWYVDSRGHEFEKGDAVTVLVARAKVKEDEVWVAHSLDCNGTSLSYWDSGRPLWDQP